MGNLLLRVRSLNAATLSGTCGLLVLLAVGISAPTSAREVKVPKSVFNATAAREFRPAVFVWITAEIIRQTTFQQSSPDGLIRWSTQTVKLVEFVKAPSPTYAGTYLYAMRYVVSVLSDRRALAAYGCQVTVVYKYDEYAEPTVSCQPVKPNLPPLEG